MWTREGLKQQAKAALRRNYKSAVVVTLITSLVSPTYNAFRNRDWQQSFPLNASAMTPGQRTLFAALLVLAVLSVIAIRVLVSNPIRVGASHFHLRCRKQSNTPVNEILFGFRHNYGNIVAGMFLCGLLTWLWSLLLIVPGIIKAYEWLLVPYILAEHPDLKPREARALSSQLMDGHKWDTFVLHLSFLGWLLLATLTYNVLGLFFVYPYTRQTSAELYCALKNESSESVA